MGYNIGLRLIEDFLAKSNTGQCTNLRETAEMISKVGFKVFMNITPTVTNWSQDGKSFVLVFEENPLADFVELPDDGRAQNELWYSNILCGVIRGACEMVGTLYLRQLREVSDADHPLNYRFKCRSRHISSATSYAAMIRLRCVLRSSGSSRMRCLRTTNRRSKHMTTDKTCHASTAGNRKTYATAARGATISWRLSRTVTFEHTCQCQYAVRVGATFQGVGWGCTATLVEIRPRIILGARVATRSCMARVEVTACTGLAASFEITLRRQEQRRGRTCSLV